MKQQRFPTKMLVLTGLLAALTAAGSALRIKVPLDIVGTSAFHLGNILCALSGILLGPWLGGLAAGFGSALYDIILDPSYISECWITFLTKFAYGFVVGLIIRGGKRDWGYPRALLATTVGACVYAALYLAKSYFYSGLLIYGLTPEAALLSLVGKIPATVFNAVVAIVAAPIFGLVLRKALKKSRLL